MVRQYIVHTNLDDPMKDKVYDTTNGKIRFYNPSNLGIEVANNMWGADGIGVLGQRTINQPNLTFDFETFGTTLSENYKLVTDFIQDLLSVKYITLEYRTENFQVFGDFALGDFTKTEGYGQNGTFSEKITFEPITKWYTFETLEFKTLQNGAITSGVSKIYGGQAPGNYKYIEGTSYTYYGETDIERLSRWDIDRPFFSFVAQMTPTKGLAKNQKYGFRFLNMNGNQYSAILFNFEDAPDLIQVNTDVNDEFYLSTSGGLTINAFPLLDFQAYRTRIFSEGQMFMMNLAETTLKVKRKVDFI